jgi:hypothetical protein
LANEQGGGDLLPLDNLWTGVNNFNPTPNQPYGSTMSQGLTITNNQSNSGTGLGTQLISYTPTGTIGFAIYSLASSANTLSTTYSLQLKPDGVSSVLQAQGANGIAELNATGTGGKIILQSSTGVKLHINPTINFNEFGTLSASATGISSSVDLNLPAQTFSSIVTYGDVAATQGFVRGAINSVDTADVFLGSNNNFTGENNFNNNINGGTTSNIGLTIVGNNQIGEAEADIICINQTTNLGLNIYAETTPVTNTTVPKIQIFNDGTATVFNTDITLPAQTTYTPSTTYGDVASTQQFVQLALASQGSGDVTLGGTNNFTGTNTFNTNAPTTTLVQTFPSTDDTNFATIGYVNSLASPTASSVMTAGSGISYIGYSNNISSNYIGTSTFFTGFVDGFVPSSNTFSLNISSTIPGSTFSTQLTNITLYNVSTRASWGMSSAILTNSTLTITFTATLDAPYTFNLTFSGNTY